MTNDVNIYKRKRFLQNIAISLTGIMLFTSCLNRGTKPLNETPTRGNIKISVDESFQPLLETEIFTFTHLYGNANITPLYKPEYDVVEDFMNDSVRVMVTVVVLSVLFNSICLMIPSPFIEWGTLLMLMSPS